MLVETFTVRPLPGWLNDTLPERPQLRAKAPLARVTFSLNTTSRSPAAGKVLLPCAGTVVLTEGGVLGPPVPGLPLKDWPALQPPKVCAADGAQVKCAYWLPLPVSCREVPGAVLLLSATGMFWLVMPAAGPPAAVSVPS